MLTVNWPRRCGAGLVALLLGTLLRCGSSVALASENATALTTGADDGTKTDLPAPQRILSRKRRFLTFPEGSSFQVVYDQTIPMIGIEQLITIGVTVALAYELPSMTFNQIEKMIEENEEDDAIAAAAGHSKMDTNANGTVLVDSNATPVQKNIFSYYYQTPRPGQPWSAAGAAGGGERINYYKPAHVPESDGANRRYDMYDRNRQRQSQWERFIASSLPRIPHANPSRNDFGSIVNRYLQSWIRRHPPNYPMNKKHLYPVFGKRSIREDTSPLDRHFLNHHRTTRHTLYEQIEKFLTAKGKPGQHCVLRALCESGQRSNDSEPDTFLKEILRAIFSLPSTHATPTHHKHRLYDEAHAHTGNCAETYSYCKDSFWSREFVF